VGPKTGHLKNFKRMKYRFLKPLIRAEINVALATAMFNLQKLLRNGCALYFRLLLDP
jgi:hypothetical protein